MSQPFTFTHDPAPEASRRILVVDDNQSIHDDFLKILGSDASADEFELEDAAFFGNAAAVRNRVPFDLDFASQGQESLDRVKAAIEAGRRYSVVFMDVRMPPGWDGIETTSRLWEVDPDLQVVLCTAYSDYSWEEMVGRLGRTDRLLILKKPFDIIEVVQCAHALTSKWALLQQSRFQAASLESTVRSRTAELEAANASLRVEMDEHRRSQERLRFTQFSVDNAVDAMFRAAPDSSLLYVNEATCRTLGYTVGELQELSMLDIVPELRERGWPSFWDAIRSEGHRSFETRHLAKDGRQIPIELTVAYFHFAGQELLGASARDITRRTRILEELSQARDEALESVRLKSRFLANMSHEIRTPMNGVIGMVEVLLHTNLDRDQQDYVNTIRSSADLLLNIINDLLDSSKIESGKLSFETIDFDLGAVIEDTLDLVVGIARHKGLELAACVPAGVDSHLRGDPGRLRQVLTNILANAVKFTERGEVILSVAPLAETEDDVRLRFEVRDTGIGIAAEACRRVFEPFIQADISDTRRYGGTGLGLSICRQIVEALEGEIGVDSVPGEGSTFWFHLSFGKQAAPGRAAAVRPPFPPDLRVLAVDDNPTNRKILQLQLSKLGIRSAGAAGGDEALALLREQSAGPDPYDLAVLDMQMPGMDGLTLARRIKADPAIAATRLILLSSLGDPLAGAELAAAGVGGHLVKPVKQSRLEAALATVFGGPAEPAAAGEMRATGGSAPPRPLRILVADDNPVNRKVTLLQLQRLGYSAGVAADGAEVLRALEKVPYDVILMDCQMPVMDGFAATREIRRLHQRPIRIIALTANAMEGDRRMCLEAGMDAFVSKPVRPAELAAQLEDCRRLPLAGTPLPAAEPGDPDPVDLDRLLEISGHETRILRQLCHDYLEQAEEILNLIASAIGRHAPDEIRQLAHKLGGSSSSCGMRAIVGPLRRLEKLGEAQPSGLFVDLHRDAVHQLSRIRRFLLRLPSGRSAGEHPTQS